MFFQSLRFHGLESQRPGEASNVIFRVLDFRAWRANALERRQMFFQSLRFHGLESQRPGEASSVFRVLDFMAWRADALDRRQMFFRVLYFKAWGANAL